MIYTNTTRRAHVRALERHACKRPAQAAAIFMLDLDVTRMVLKLIPHRRRDLAPNPSSDRRRRKLDPTPPRPLSHLSHHSTVTAHHAEVRDALKSNMLLPNCTCPTAMTQNAQPEVTISYNFFLLSKEKDVTIYHSYEPM